MRKRQPFIQTRQKVPGSVSRRADVYPHQCESRRTVDQTMDWCGQQEPRSGICPSRGRDGPTRVGEEKLQQNGACPIPCRARAFCLRAARPATASTLITCIEAPAEVKRCRDWVLVQFGRAGASTVWRSEER